MSEPTPEEISQAAREMAKLCAESLTPEQRKERARKGGLAAQAKRTAAERSASASKAAQARWHPESN